MAAAAALKVRQLSTTAARPVSKLVKPPIQVYGLEGRYATALYSAASKQKKLEQVEKELTRVWVRCSTAGAPWVWEQGGFPCFSGGRWAWLLQPLRLPDPWHMCCLPYAPVFQLDIGKEFLAGRVGRPWHNFSSVPVFQPLAEASLTELKSALNGFLAKGEVLKLETKTDPSILGGMIVNIGEKYVDMSTRSKIQKLTKIMRESV
ncbi:PREDICTED: ATP synthase subunit O, mitochondrial [Lepidothrix coronata]|uniref:ATP synthase peripheral stalk subunit OSCP, mitochondrial n=1 Tax=Lepidothrix coronata TaxID=321398 RepID=A0A6J0IPM8_9PASS|nr:PREDICTED: ATP synthase subunit O, mitochondrial [Lepidothrix coronata]